jgi:peptidoglycan biosynthesis protein MviN/MurJ (putative lipid II flippase)
MVSIALVLSRISGILREIVVASRLGVSETADAAIVLLTLPDFMVALLLAGGLNAALVPAIKSNQGTDRLNLLFSVSTLALIGFSAISVAIIVFMPFSLATLIPSFDPTGINNFDLAFSLSAFTIPLAALVGISASFLNAIGKFVIPGIAVLLFNLLVVLFVATKDVDAYFLLSFGGAIFIGTIIRLIFHLFSMRQLFTDRFSQFFIPTGLISSLAQGTTAFGLIVAVPIVFRSIFASGGDGYLTVFNYSYKLFELPAAILVAPIAVALLPRLSVQALNNDKLFDKYLKNGLTVTFALATISSLIGVIFIDEIVSLLFGYGEITLKDQFKIASSASIMLCALPFYGFTQIAIIAMNAQMQNKKLLYLAVVATSLSLLIYIALARILYTEYLAQISFLIFSVVLSALTVWRTAARVVCDIEWVKGIWFLVLRVGMVIVPTAGLKFFIKIDSVVIMLVFMSVSTLLCFLAILPELMMLTKMKTDNT